MEHRDSLGRKIEIVNNSRGVTENNRQIFNKLFHEKQQSLFLSFKSSIVFQLLRKLRMGNRMDNNLIVITCQSPRNGHMHCLCLAFFNAKTV